MSYYPYEFLDEEGKPSGFNIDIIEAIAKVMRLDIRIELERWSDVRKQIEARQIDGVTGMFYSKSRSRLVNFSTPHLIISHAIFARKDSPIRGISDIAGKEVIVQLGGIEHDYLISRDIAGAIISVVTQEDALRLLASGRHDCALLAKVQGELIVKRLGLDNVSTVGAPFEPRKYCIGINKNDPMLLSMINEGMSIIKDSGEYDRIYDKWFGVTAFEPEEQESAGLPMQPYVLASVFLLFVYGLTILLFRRNMISQKREIHSCFKLKKQSESALHESEQRYRQLIESTSEGYWLCDKDEKTLAVNTALTNMLGYSQEEMIGRPFVDFVAENDRSLYLEQASLISSSSNRVYELHFLRSDGTFILGVVSAATLASDQEGAAASFAFITNITDRKKIEEDLKRANSILLHVLDSIEAGISIIDPQALEPLFLNKQMLALTKNREGALALIHRWRNQIRGVKSGHSISRWEDFGSDDREFFMNKAAATTWLDGRDVVILLTLDISERKRMEHQVLLSKEAAETANTAKGEFLANMSHEIRTPLNGIMGMLQLIRGTSLNPEQEDFLETALTSCKSLLRVLSDILDFSKVDAGKMSIEEDVFNLKELLEDVASVFRQQAREKNVTLQWETCCAASAAFVGDAGRIRQILLNLIGNALKFTSEGNVFFEAHPLQSRASDGLARIYFSVKDSGVGIPDNMLDLVFKAFSQVDGSYSRRFQGTGLGLGIVQKLVALMGGNICLASQTGEGTEVHFSLNVKPAYKGAVVAERGTSNVSQGSLEGLHVLLVEDERVNRFMAKRLLEKAGFSVSSAENGKEAVLLLEETRFDCVLMDIQMPVMDGMAATRIIRSSSSPVLDAEIPIIAMTAHAMKGDREEFIEAGMDGYIAKPVDKDALLLEISRVLTLKSRLD